MFDSETETLLRRAPALEGLSPETLPERFTEAYAQLVAARVRGVSLGSDIDEDEWSLGAIADVYELIVTTSPDREAIVPAAFVAATAQQLLAQAARHAADGAPPATVVTRDAVAPEVAAPLLFLIARQYADAADAAERIAFPKFADDPFARQLLRSIVLLCQGRVAQCERLVEDVAARSADLFHRAEEAIQVALLRAVKQIASQLLGADDSQPRELIEHIIASCDGQTLINGRRTSSFPGYQHLAQLLMLAFDAFEESALVGVPPPPGVDDGFWREWVRDRARTAPFIWPNHRDAVDAGFHHPGTSAVLVLPTGAGKTTLASMKIAAALGQGSQVVVLAPTHALVEQLTNDFAAVFGSDSAGAADEDRSPISVMTPERCLAMLSFRPEAFDDVSLVVFDEAHLLSIESGTRRSIDAMLAVLLLTRRAPYADLLMLTAMLRNGSELAEWLGSLTGRRSLFFDPLWKPSRQARGVIMYRDAEVSVAVRAAEAAQASEDARLGRKAAGIRARAREQLRLTPFGLFGLENNWLNETTADVTIQQLLDYPVALDGKLVGEKVKLMPSVNNVATAIAHAAANGGLKPIVFANVKSHTIAIARRLRDHLSSDLEVHESDREMWDDLERELGSLEYAFNSPNDTVVCHNGLMLRTERLLAERSFRRPDGARVIVATPTLAQGMNLPADVAVLASEMRASRQRGREALAAHELMNAAARAGRAGHVSNGLVILISERVLSFGVGEELGEQLVDRLKAILPTDDRSIKLVDPLQHVLDTLSTGRIDDPDVDYLVHRLILEDELDNPLSIGIAQRSFAGFQAARAGLQGQFQSQIEQLREVVVERSSNLQSEEFLKVIAAQTGLPASLLLALKDRLEQCDWPDSVADWVSWTFGWLKSGEHVSRQLFGDEVGALSQSVGQPLDHEMTGADFDLLNCGVQAWIKGLPLRAVEVALGSNVDTADLACLKARTLATKAIPLSITFAVSVVTLVARGLERDLTDGAQLTLDSLVPAVRQGFNSPVLVAFAHLQGRRSLRVTTHLEFGLLPGLSSVARGTRTLDGLIPLVDEWLAAISD